MSKNTAAKYQGCIYPTKSNGDVVIKEYVSAKKVHVKFIVSGYETITQMSHIKSGIVKDKLLPSVYPVGGGDEYACGEENPYSLFDNPKRLHLAVHMLRWFRFNNLEECE